MRPQRHARLFAGKISENFEHSVDGAIRETMTDTNCLHAVEPIELAVTRLKQRGNAKVVARRIHGFTALQTLDDLCGTVPQTTISHRHRRSLIGLDCKA